MSSPISCNECRRRKIKCDKSFNACGNCSKKGVNCVYPSKFRSIKINNIIKPAEQQNSNSEDSHENIREYKDRIRKLEEKLATTEDLISIFDTAGGSDHLKQFGSSSLTELEHSMIPQLSSFYVKIKDVNLEKKPLPVLIEDDTEENISLIRSLIEEYYEPDEYNHFRGLVAKGEITAFLDMYEGITEWTHDETMMLLLVTLVDVLKKYTNQYGTKKHSRLKNPSKIVRNMICFYYYLLKIQTSDSLNTIKSQMVLLNYYYYSYNFTCCWKILFQIISNAYSIGLHLTQGDIWVKINLIESVMCGVAAKPNIINHRLLKKEVNDEFGEFEFISLLRLKNEVQIFPSFENKRALYDDILQTDAKFEDYALFLKLKIESIKDQLKAHKENDPVRISLKANLERAQVLALSTLSFQLNLHHDWFEFKIESEQKTSKLLIEFCEILKHIIHPSQLNKLRDKFTALECLTYQVFLIYLKYLNFKSIRSLLVYDGENLQQETASLLQIQTQMNELVTLNPFYPCLKVVKILETIKDFDIEHLKPRDLVRPYSNTAVKNEDSSEGSSISEIASQTCSLDDLNNCYTSEEVRSILTDIERTRKGREFNNLEYFMQESYPNDSLASGYIL